jgi:hypothetical protein
VGRRVVWSLLIYRDELESAQHDPTVDADQGQSGHAVTQTAAPSGKPAPLADEVAFDPRAGHSTGTVPGEPPEFP